jgi:four helix bundle protein
MHQFEELKIWKKAMDIAEEVYQLTALFPKEEKYGLTSQIRKSAVSISSNIAEGAGRNTSGEFKNFLGIANGSTNELYTQLLLCHRLNLVEMDKVQHILGSVREVQKMNYGLIQSLPKN